MARTNRVPDQEKALTEQQDHTDDIQHALGLDQASGQGRKFWLWIGIGAMVAAAILVVLYFRPGPAPDSRYKTLQVTQDTLVVKVTATGILEPVNQVEVGTEVSGTVKSVAVDFNDRVKRGQVLAQLDTDQLEAKSRQSRAAYDLARARVREAEATVTESRNRFRRLKQLEAKGLCAQEDCEAAEATYKRAEAALASARAQVTQAQAQMDSDRTALSKAVIRAPIDGIVLKRVVEPGQTVAAMLQTPVLFVLAETLAQMELLVAVDEADVGQVKEGQQATFTVDAFPERSFPASISQVRFAPKSAEGVVTYETVLKVDNSDLLLRPGMTATADITTQQIENALLVPNSALRFTPPAEPVEGKRSGGLVRQLLPRPPHGSTKKVKEEPVTSRQTVWILREGQPVAVPVIVGPTDGIKTQIIDGKLEAGQTVIVDVINKKD